jgi:hypothetical protein
MGRKINNISNEDLQLLGSHVSQTVFHVAFFESVLTWGHITTSKCWFVGGESGIFAYSPPLIGYTILPATTNFNRPWCIPLTLTV